jgi:hypothetical protein
MKSKTISKALVFVLAFSAVNLASAATYTLIKASAVLPGLVSGTDTFSNPTLTKKTLRTNALINLALGNPTKTKVPRTTVLAIAAESSSMSPGSTPTNGLYLLVVDMTPHNSDPLVEPTILRTILVPDNASIKTAEDTSKAGPPTRLYQRVGVGNATVQQVGSILGGGQDIVQSAGVSTIKRIPEKFAPTDIITIKMNFNGQFHYRDVDVASPVDRTAIVTGGTLTAKGKSIGTVTIN